MSAAMIMLMCRMLVRTDRVDDDRAGMAVDGTAGEQAQHGTQDEKGFHDRIPGKGCGRPACLRRSRGSAV